MCFRNNDPVCLHTKKVILIAEENGIIWESTEKEGDQKASVQNRAFCRRSFLSEGLFLIVTL